MHTIISLLPANANRKKENTCSSAHAALRGFERDGPKCAAHSERANGGDASACGENESGRLLNASASKANADARIAGLQQRNLH